MNGLVERLRARAACADDTNPTVVDGDGRRWIVVAGGERWSPGSRVDVFALCDEVDRLRAQVRALRFELDHCRGRAA